MKEAVPASLAAQLSTFFSEDVRKLVQCWTKCDESKATMLKTDAHLNFLCILK